MTKALEDGAGSASSPGRSYLRERAGTHCTGGWVGPRAVLDRCGKPRPPSFDPRIVQLVASQYTDYASRPITLAYAGTEISDRDTGRVTCVQDWCGFSLPYDYTYRPMKNVFHAT